MSIHKAVYCTYKCPETKPHTCVLFSVQLLFSLPNNLVRHVAGSPFYRGGN